VLPIALNNAWVSGRMPGTAIGTVALGSGNYVWLAWRSADASNQAVWRTSMSATTPNSANYQDPTNTSDTHMDVNNWITTGPNLDNNNDNKNCLDAALNRDLIVPVFSTFTTGSPGRVQISGFALLRITNRDNNLGGDEEVALTFVRTCDSNGN
jgi:hypothetical protein